MTYQRRTARRGSRARSIAAATRGRSATAAAPFAAEMLEGRTLLSAGISNRVLNITGTDAGNFILFSTTSNGRLQVFDNSVSQGTFRPNDFDRIAINTLGGNDVIQATSLKPMSVDMGTHDAEGGRDRIELGATAGNDAIDISAGRIAVGAQTYDFVNTEQVFIWGGSGNDAFRVLPPAAGAPAGTAEIWAFGGGGNDTFEGIAPWAGSIYFDGETDDDRMTAEAHTRFTFDGGDGTDVLRTSSSNQSDYLSMSGYSIDLYLRGPGPTQTNVRQIGFDYVEQLDVVLGPSGASTGSPHELLVNIWPTLGLPTPARLNVTGSADNDLVRGFNAGGTPATIALAFNGNGGDDRLDMEFNARLTANYDGGPGNNALTFYGGDADDLIVADADSVNDAQDRVDFLNVGHVTLGGGNGADTFQVAALPTVGYLVRGDFTTFSDADRLEVNRNGGTPSHITYATNSKYGAIHFTDRQAIAYEGIDVITGLEDMKPSASAGGPYTVVEGKTVQLDASASQPFEGGSIVSYEWDFDYNGTTFDVNATGVKPTFSAAGLTGPLTRNVAVRVKDAGNRVAVATGTVNVIASQLPVANPNGPYETYLHNFITLSSAGSHDPDGTIAGFEWDLDYDGVTFNVDSTSGSPSLTPNQAKVYTVALRVRDNSNRWSPVATTTLTVRRSDPPGVNPGGPYVTNEWSTFQLNAVPAPAQGDPVQRIDWDFDYDGVTFTVDRQQMIGTPTFHAHQWDGPSTRNAAVRVTTLQGQTAIAPVTIQVNNVAPQPSMSGIAETFEGDYYNLSLTRGSDPASLVDVGVSWQVDWGDGTVETLPGHTTSAIHRFMDGPAERAITARFTDDDGTYPAAKHLTSDTSFSGDGWTTNSAGGANASVRQILPLPDGKVLTVSTGSSRINLFRYNQNGTPDNSFGTLGLQSNTFPGIANVFDAVLQTDGKVVVAGGTPNASGQTTFTVLRYRADGVLDTTFGNGGIVQREFTGGGSQAMDLELLSDGRILVGAAAPGAWVAGGSTTYNSAFTLVRLMPDGSPDATFGTGGVSQPTFSEFGQPSLAASLAGIRLRADGTILAVGQHTRNPNAFVDVAIARYSDTGTLLDVQFRQWSGTINPRQLAFVNDDSFVVGVDVGFNMFARYSYTSTPVTTASMGSLETLGDLLPQPDGSVIVAGVFNNTNLMLARFTADNARDAGIGGGTSGRVFVGTTSNLNTVNAVAQTPAGSIYLGGNGGANGGDMLLGKFKPGGNVFVRNTNPTLGVTAPTDAAANDPVNIQFTATDPGTDTISSWTVNWGDGFVETLPGNAAGSTHAYTWGGTKGISVTAFDEDGGPYTAPSVSVQVTSPPPAVVDGVLRVWTGDTMDHVALSVIGADVLVDVNGSSSTFPLASVTSIDVRTFLAGDVVSIGAGVPTGYVELGTTIAQDTLAVTGPTAGDAPLAVKILGGNVTLAPGVRADLTLSNGSATTVNLSGTEEADAWVLLSNLLSGAGNVINWTGLATVNVNALGGDDEFDVDNTTASANFPRPNYRLDGGAGNDAVRVLNGSYVNIVGGGATSAGGGLVYFGGDGDDTMETAGLLSLRGTAGFSGDAGNDLLVFNGRADAADDFTVSGTSVRRGEIPPTNTQFTVTSGRQTSTPLPWEEVRVLGHGGNDRFIAGVVVLPLGLQMLLDGGEGDDTFAFGNDSSDAFRTPVTFRGGNGADAVTVNDRFSKPAPPSYALDGTGVRRGGAADPRHTFEEIESAALATSGSADDVTVTPSAATTLSVDAGNPTTTPGDKLRLNLAAGVTGAARTSGPAAGSGTYTFGNRQPVNYTGVEDAQELVAPRVTAMFLSSTQWTAAYKQSLQLTQQGSATYGYVVRSSDVGKTLPWTNLNQISVRFSEHVNVAADDFVLNGVNLAQYGLSADAAQAFTYDPVTFTATWTLNRFIANDKVTVRLDAGEGTGVTDGHGNRLDGEPANFVTHSALFPTGDGVPGGDFALTVRVLPADVDRNNAVNIYDYNRIRSNLNTTGKSVWDGDLNGDGVVNMTDLNAMLANLGKTTPA